MTRLHKCPANLCTVLMAADNITTTAQDHQSESVLLPVCRPRKEKKSYCSLTWKIMKDKSHVVCTGLSLWPKREAAEETQEEVATTSNKQQLLLRLAWMRNGWYFHIKRTIKDNTKRLSLARVLFNSSASSNGALTQHNKFDWCA